MSYLIDNANYTGVTASTGRFSGFEVTVNAGRVLDVAEGVGYINIGTGVVRIAVAAQ